MTLTPYRPPLPRIRKQWLGTGPRADTYDTMILAESGLEAYLPLSEASGLLNDWTGGGHHGVSSGGLTQGVSASFPNASLVCQFAVASYGIVTLRGTFSLGDGPWTYELWVRRSTIGGAWQGLIGQNAISTTGMAFNDFDGGPDGAANTPTSFQTSGGTGAQTAYAITDTTTWHHIVVTKTTGDVWKMYVDGADRTSNVGTGSSVSSAQPVVLGDWPFSGAFESLNGYMAKVAIYREVISDAQVLTHYRMLVPPALGFPRNDRRHLVAL